MPRNVQGEATVATMQAGKVPVSLEPFVHLRGTLSACCESPTAVETKHFEKPPKGAMCRLINAFKKIRKAILKKKMLKKCVRTCYVYENKQISDKMPGEKSDIYV